MFEMMRRAIGMLALLGLVAASVAVLGGRGPALAQDSTTSDKIAVNELAPGVTAEIFTAAPSVGAPGKTVYTARFVFQAGAEIFPHGHPGTTVLGVQSGTFGWTLTKGVAHVVRGAASGTPGQVKDVTVPGTEVLLQPGDAIYYESDVIHTARGAGDEPAVVLGTLVLDTGAPLLMPANMDMGTPAS
jgi:quercetin dioxygenase-like cupin family protein